MKKCNYNNYYKLFKIITKCKMNKDYLFQQNFNVKQKTNNLYSKLNKLLQLKHEKHFNCIFLICMDNIFNFSNFLNFESIELSLNLKNYCKKNFNSVFASKGTN